VQGALPSSEKFAEKKEISTEAAEALIRCGRRGILAVNRENGCPYAVSINNLYDGD
jgi:hypothetical protein